MSVVLYYQKVVRKQHTKEDIKMLWNEFVEGTGCKDNEKNYKVYKDLEVMYMNSDLTKDEIYEYGKKLVDNSKSEAELKVEAEVEAQIKYHKEEIEKYKRYIEYDSEFAKMFEEDDKQMAKQYRNQIKHWKEEIKANKMRINALKRVLA